MELSDIKQENNENNNNISSMSEDLKDSFIEPNNIKIPQKSVRNLFQRNST